MAKTIILWTVILTLLAGLFSFRILESPLGLTADEAAFAYNATLLSKTGLDENGRRLPVFVLSLGGTDWRQPVTQYYLTVFLNCLG